MLGRYRQYSLVLMHKNKHKKNLNYNNILNGTVLEQRNAINYITKIHKEE